MTLGNVQNLGMGAARNIQTNSASWKDQGNMLEQDQDLRLTLGKDQFLRLIDTSGPGTDPRYGPNPCLDIREDADF